MSAWGRKKKNRTKTVFHPSVGRQLLKVFTALLQCGTQCCWSGRRKNRKRKEKMKHNKHCSRSQGPGGARRKGLWQRQEAIKVHSAAAGSVQTQHSPPSTRGGGDGERGQAARIAHPSPRATGATRAGLREGAEAARGNPAARSAPLSRSIAASSARGWAPSPTARAGVTCMRLPPSGRLGRGAERSGRRGRGRPWPPPLAILSRRPLPGEGAVGQASALPVWERGSPPHSPPLSAPGPRLDRPLAHGRGPPAGGAWVGLRHPSRKSPEPSRAGTRLSQYLRRSGPPWV